MVEQNVNLQSRGLPKRTDELEGWAGHMVWLGWELWDALPRTVMYGIVLHPDSDSDTDLQVSQRSMWQTEDARGHSGLDWHWTGTGLSYNTLAPSFGSGTPLYPSSPAAPGRPPAQP